MGARSARRRAALPAGRLGGGGTSPPARRSSHWPGISSTGCCGCRACIRRSGSVRAAAGPGDGASMPSREEVFLAGPARREERHRLSAEAMMFLMSRRASARIIWRRWRWCRARARARNGASPPASRASRQGLEVCPRPQGDAAALARPRRRVPSMVTLQQLSSSCPNSGPRGAVCCSSRSTSRWARGPCIPRRFCACSARSRGAWPTCSRRGGPPTAASARTRTASSSTSSSRSSSSPRRTKCSSSTSRVWSLRHRPARA